MSYEIKHKDKFRFLEEGEGEPLVLLHGLFGALSNFENLIEYFRQYNKVIVPVDTHVRIIVTGADVIHSFTVPSLGIKIDTVPGRLNQTSLLAERTGTFYGQCSEICGVYHGFMPIAIESVSVQDYLAWVDAQ